MIKHIVSALVLFSVGASSFAATQADWNAIEKEAQKVNAIRASDEYRVTMGDMRAHVDKNITNLDNKFTTALSGAIALSSVPTVPGKALSFGVGYGGFDGENSVAFGVNFTPENDPITFKAGISPTSEGLIYGGGFAFGF